MKLALVYYSYRLALASYNRLGSYKVDSRLDSKHCTHGVLERLLHVLYLAHLVGELLGKQLDIYIKGVGVVYPVDGYLVVGRIALV